MEKQIDYKGYTIVIVQEEHPMCPRKEWDNFGVMACYHKRYNLGDSNFKEVESFQELYDKLTKEGAIVLPLYLYDHSGLTISTTPFSCPWDSGQVGIIYATREAIKKEFSIKRNISSKTREKVITILQNEVKTYNDYLTGNVYGFEIKDSNGETIESCSGYYGYESDESKWDVLINAKDVVDHLLVLASTK